MLKKLYLVQVQKLCSKYYRKNYKFHQNKYDLVSKNTYDSGSKIILGSGSKIILRRKMVVDRRGRPKIISDEDLLDIIRRHGEISQRRLQDLTGMKKSTLSMRIKLLHNQGKIKVRNIRHGRSTLSFISLAAFDQPHMPVKPIIRLEREDEEEQHSSDFSSRLTDPSYLRELLIRDEIDEAIIDLLDDSTVLGLANARLTDLISVGIPSEIAEEILQVVEEARKFLSNQF